MVVGEFTEDADIVVIGGGPAGYACAFRAAELGRDVVLVDPRGTLGGNCLHEACIPTKTVLHAIDLTRQSSHPCLTGDPPSVNADATRKWIDRITKRLGGGLAAAAKAKGVEVLAGHARFLGNREVQVAGEHVSRFRFKRAVICCGGGQQQPANGALTVNALCTSLDRVSGTAVVLGNGPWALEAAAICHSMGASTTLVPGSQPVLPGVPTQLIDTIGKACGFDIMQTGEASVEATNDGCRITVGEQILDPDVFIDASSKPPNFDGLDLDAAGVDLAEGGWIDTDDRCVTSEPRILAAGTCTESLGDAGMSLAQGRVAAEVIDGRAAAWDPAAIPTLVFSHPQLAWCGSCPDDAETLLIPWSHSGLAVSMNASTGCTLICWDKESGTLLGAGAVGVGASEMADLFTVAIELGSTLQDLADMSPAHPTRSELLLEAARQALA